MQRKELFRIFFTSFVITLIAFCFVMSFIWVDLKADRNGFPGFLPSLRLEQVEPLVYELDTPIRQYRLDFTPAERFADTSTRRSLGVARGLANIYPHIALYSRAVRSAQKISSGAGVL